jgi:hypothetical protein
MPSSSPPEQVTPGPVSGPQNYRIGFHYFPDTRHYRQRDLETWLPELCNLGASWVTLLAEAERAIPEAFLGGLLAASIQPVLHFVFQQAQVPAKPADLPYEVGSLRLLLSNYARWGLQYVCFFDRPNIRSHWPAPVWAQTDLVERFLDQFIPLAELTLEEGLTPVFPPLEPGGDYWDLAFLRTALKAMQRRGCLHMLDSLVLGAYGFIDNGRPLDWGAGGPQRWPGAKPYQTPEGLQDQRGLYIVDWYEDVVQHELGKHLPVILLRGGARLPARHGVDVSQPDLLAHARQNLAVARLMAGDQEADLHFEPLSADVLTCNFWLLAAEKSKAGAAQAWFRPNGEPLPAVNALRQWIAYRKRGGAPEERGREPSIPVAQSDAHPKDVQDRLPAIEKPVLRHPIQHYILLPLYAWGAADWDMVAIQPLLQDSHPTVGFSLAEARLAKRVTVVGGEGAISMEALEMLRGAGCQVERILEDGTLIAT